MSATTSNLPLDIIAGEILPKLPTKTLIRFKSISKTFKTLISSPEFANNHSSSSSPSDNHRFLIISGDENSLISCDLDSPSAATFRWSVDTTVSSVGSCKGLLLIRCIVDLRISFVVVNPATRTYISPIHIPSSVDTVKENGRLVFRFGFGYDEIENNYKIVIVSEDVNSGHKITSVYSMNYNSWNVVEERKDPLMSRWAVVDLNSEGVLINNRVIHWTPIAVRPTMIVLTSRKPKIACFDIVTEKWMDDMLFPSCYYDLDVSRLGYSPEIGVVDDRLVVLFDPFASESLDHRDLELWVMNEYGVTESWVKLFNITMSLGVSRFDQRFVPVFCRGEGVRDVLLWQQCKGEQYKEGKMIWYNRKEDEGELVQHPKVTYKLPCVCEASLVTLPDAKLYHAGEVNAF